MRALVLAALLLAAPAFAHDTGEPHVHSPTIESSEPALDDRPTIESAYPTPVPTARVFTLRQDLVPGTPTPIPTASPAPTPTLEPRCEDAGPLVPCRARQDPAAVLNQRVTNLEQQLNQLAQQIGQVIRQQNERIDALTPKPAAKK